ncbi:MAG: amino acid adenylation domain-containing protein [Cyanobacteria bacterium J06639_16]
MVLDNHLLSPPSTSHPSASGGNGTVAPISQQIEALASKSNLTVAQLLLWLGQKLHPADPLYNMVFSFTIGGEIDPFHFQQAFQALVNRCDVLRLTITEVDGVPHQSVSPALDYHLPCLDFSTTADPQALAQQWIRNRATCALDLSISLFDAALLKLGSNQFIWYLNQHHLSTDNWSVSLIYRQLQADYGRSLSGTLAAAPEIPAYLPQAELPSPRQQKAISYWQQKREDLPPPVSLYGQTSKALSTRTQRTYCELGMARSQALRALAATPEARSLSVHQSQFNLFLTLLFAYLYRISGEHALAIASPSHNRPTPALKETPGLFIELFPLRVEITPDETFASLLKKVARESTAFLRYAQTGISHHAVDRNINVVMSYINVTFPNFHGMPAQTDWVHADAGDAQHHLRLEVHDFDATGNFTVQFDFNADLISAAQQQWAPEQFCKLLDAWLDNGQQQIATVDILADAERSLIAAPYPTSIAAATPSTRPQTLVERFQQQVARVPNQTAVVWETQHLTYAQLEAEANQLAHYLVKQGVSQGTTVGLLMTRSLSMAVAILGVLKAGAAYLPIDPAYPAERTAFMVADGQVAVLLTQASLMEKVSELLPSPPAPLPGGEGSRSNAVSLSLGERVRERAFHVDDLQIRVISLEAHSQAIAQSPTTAPEVALQPEDLAYILYTSGSTGQPKGVMVEHRNVLAMLGGFEQTAPTGETLRGTAVCSYGFDVSVWELFSNLCFGGTVHLVPPDVVTSHDRFAQYLVAHDITSAYIPPALLRTVIDVLEQGKDAIALDRILVGVEPIQQGLLQRYRQRIPQLRIVNGYGPTETTICATFHSFDTATDPQANTPIGTAIPGYEVYLVNSQGQQVPIGVKGEIVIGGAGLSRGYLHRPELMSQRFIDNPFGPGKFYKTGDQARYLPDGNLEFLGRLDHQVKVRGFRVELSEVETALNQHPRIQQAVVIAQETTSDSQTLVAYLMAPDASPTSSEIRDALKQKLPAYMVPSVFILLDALPLTPNGKVDRRRLSSTDYAQRERLGADAGYVAPKNEWETYLVGLWGQCLRVASVGIHDNFFDLGGDSITAIQIAAQATEAGLALSPQQILQQATIARLVAQMNPATATAQSHADTSGTIPLTPIQQAFFEQNLTDAHHWNQTLLLDVAYPLDPQVLEAAVQRLLQHHAVLNFRFVSGESGWQQLPSDPELGGRGAAQTLQSPSKASFQYLNLSHQSTAEQDQSIAIAEAELQTSLNLAAGDLVRVALFNLGGDRPNRLLLIIHHLVVDGVSWLALLDHLEIFYRQLQGESVPTPLPTTPFETWSTGLVAAVSSGAFRSELDYWLKPAQTTLKPLSLDVPIAGDNTVASTQTITTILDSDQTRSLLKEIPKLARAQVNEVLLTALMLTFCEESDPTALLVDMESHGREESVVPGVNLVRTVGWFTTVFPLLLTLSPQSDLGEKLQAVKAQLRSVPSNGIGYGLLRYLDDDVRVKEQLQALPQAEILFNYLGDLAGLLSPNSRFKLACELCLSRSPKGQRRYQLEVNAAVVDGQLQVAWSYSKRVHSRETVQGWADGLMTGLRSLMAYYLSSESSQENTYTPVDFPLANLNAQKLGKIAALLNKRDRP